MRRYYVGRSEVLNKTMAIKLLRMLVAYCGYFTQPGHWEPLGSIKDIHFSNTQNAIRRDVFVLRYLADDCIKEAEELHKNEVLTDVSYKRIVTYCNMVKQKSYDHAYHKDVYLYFN